MRLSISQQTNAAALLAKPAAWYVVKKHWKLRVIQLTGLFVKVQVDIQKSRPKTPQKVQSVFLLPLG